MSDPQRIDPRPREADREAGTVTIRQGQGTPPLREDARPPVTADPPPASTAPHRGEEENRGREAERPGNIPARGWKDIAWRVYRGLDEDRILMNAAGVTFYALLALFPAIAALVSIYGLFADPAQIAGQLDTLAGILPGGGMTVIGEQLTRLAAQGSGSLTFGLVFGVLVSLWSANGGMKALFDALNVVYGEEEKRSFVQMNVISLTFTLGMLCFAIVAMTVVLAVPIVLNLLPDLPGTGISWVRWPVMAVLIPLALALIYRYGPSRNDPRWRWISWGSVFAAVGWLMFSAAFSFYATNFGTFNQTYGSLGAVIGFMLWIWLSVTVILLGGKLNAEIERRTARDMTAGEPGPAEQRAS